MSSGNYFMLVQDPRVVGRCKHKLSDILMIALITYISGGQDYSDMYDLCRERGESFRPLVELPNGTPSEDTFARVMQSVNPAALSECLRIYGERLIKDIEQVHIAIDGKKARGAAPRKTSGGGYILSAWVDECSLSIGQAYVPEKSNEITAVPALLDSLNLENAVVTLDAMGTQTAIAEKITKKKGYYILCLKGNQGTLYDDISDSFTSKQERLIYQSLEKDHGRIEKRTCEVLPVKNNLTSKVEKRWKGAQTIVRLTRHCSYLAEGKESEEVRYYISSLPYDEVTAEKMAQASFGLIGGLRIACIGTWM